MSDEPTRVGLGHADELRVNDGRLGALFEATPVLLLRAAEEHALLGAARAGDEEAFGRLASRYRSGLEIYCRLMLGCPQAAHEAVHETLLRGWRERSHLTPSASARMWLYRLATDICLEDHRGTDAGGRSP
jgi:hypothetical protein